MHFNDGYPVCIIYILWRDDGQVKYAWKGMFGYRSDVFSH